MRHLLVVGSTCTIVAGLALIAGINVSASDEPPAPGTNEFYAKRVVPILQNNCLKCHDETAKGGLQLDAYALIRKGGQDGPVIVPGDPGSQHADSGDSPERRSEDAAEVRVERY